VFTIEPDGVNLVDEGEGSVLVGDIAELLQGRDCARHGVHRLESDDLPQRGNLVHGVRGAGKLMGENLRPDSQHFIFFVT
jgi:hypothetical protein